MKSGEPEYHLPEFSHSLPWAWLKALIYVYDIIHSIIIGELSDEFTYIYLWAYMN